MIKEKRTMDMNVQGLQNNVDNALQVEKRRV